MVHICPRDGCHWDGCLWVPFHGAQGVELGVKYSFNRNHHTLVGDIGYRVWKLIWNNLIINHVKVETEVFVRKNMVLKEKYRE